MFPVIPDVEFKYVPDYPAYAVSSNGIVWHRSKDGRWHKLQPYRFCTGELVVRLHGKTHTRVVNYAELCKGRTHAPEDKSKPLR